MLAVLLVLDLSRLRVTFFFLILRESMFKSLRDKLIEWNFCSLNLMYSLIFVRTILNHDYALHLSLFVLRASMFKSLEINHLNGFILNQDLLDKDIVLSCYIAFFLNLVCFDLL